VTKLYILELTSISLGVGCISSLSLPNPFNHYHPPTALKMNPSLAPTSRLPNGQLPQRTVLPPKKKAKAADPLFGPKKRAILNPKAPNTKPRINGAPVPVLKPQPGQSPAPLGAPSPARTSPAVDDRKRTSGFSDPNGAIPNVEYRDFKLVTSKRELLTGLRYHVLQFARDSPTDIRNEKEFTRPVRLHRRDPRAVPVEQIPLEKSEDVKDDLELEEKEDFNKRKEARRLEREANLAQVAPSLDSGRKPTVIKKKTAQVHSRGYTIEERKKMQSNYEEKLPWHIEDFDNRHCYVGSNQTGSSGIHAALIHEGGNDPSNGCFRLLPIEKMYQFKAKKTYKTMTIEEAENAMKKKGRDPQWMIERKEAHMKEAQQEQLARRSRAFFGTKDENAAGRGDEGADLDFNMEEDFADDEEGDGFFEKDEDERLAETRIKEDQLNANIFGIKEETEYDKAEENERREKEKKKLIGKGIKKALEKREKNFDHASDSDDPFGSTVSISRKILIR
jgi:transcription initiation factor TFIIF subunit alpha